MKNTPVARVNNIEDILSSFKSGQISLIDGHKIFSDWLLNLNLDLVENRFGPMDISTHSRMARNNLAKPEKDLITITELTGRIRNYQDATLNGVDLFEHAACYGVVNFRRLCADRFVKHEFARHFHHSVSFLWLGLSPGSLHLDLYNNVLLQIQGKKTVTLFDPKYSERMGLSHYIPMPNKIDLFAPENVERHPWLATIPHRRVELNPGDALIIPSTCYHAPRAQTYDSLSLNVFLTPKLLRNYSSVYAKVEHNNSYFKENLKITLSKLSYALTGRPLLSWGPYEIF